MTPFKLVLASLLVALTGCTDPASAPASSAPTPADTYYSMKPCPESAQQFWTKFRAAVLKDDFDAVAAMTHFPLEVSGDGDNSPKKFVDRKNFNKHFAYLLNLNLHGSEYDPNPKPIPATMKEFSRAVANVTSLCMPDGDEISGDQLNVAKWTFLSKPDGWQLHFVHSDDFISIKTEEPLHVTPIESLQPAPIRK